MLLNTFFSFRLLVLLPPFPHRGCQIKREYHNRQLHYIKLHYIKNTCTAFKLCFMCQTTHTGHFIRYNVKFSIRYTCSIAC
uniref:Secreted protein n=1 Tax=Pygocentrus nattereri TaxID=42514 RepID=A0A3B4BRK3_PYGNA